MKIERFDEIYLRYYRLSLKVAYSVVHDVELAQDICQEVFITMFFKLDEIDEEFAKAWILSYKSYYVKGGFSHLIHMTAAHLW